MKTAVDNQDTFFWMKKSESDSERPLLDAYVSNTYLIDNVPPDTTSEQIMNDLTDLHNESYAVMRLLKHFQLPNTTATGSSSTLTSIQRDQQVTTVSSDNSLQTSLCKDFLTTNTSYPKLKVTPFDCNPMNWNLWFGLFKTLIDSKQLHDAETVGRANEAFRGFSCNSLMYQAALEEHEHRFVQPGIIVNAFLDKLRTFKTPSLQTPTTFMEVSTFVNN